MATLAPHVPDRLRDATGFGGLVPSAAVARGGETAVAALAVEHHADGVVIPLLMLSGTPGLLEWEPGMGLTIRDDRGDRYEGRLLTSASGLGQLAATIWVEPALPADATRIELIVDGLARLNPNRGEARGTSRPVGGGPWSLVIDLLPPRTMVAPPPEPGAATRSIAPGSVPVRAFGPFIDIVPVGQARHAEGIAVCVLALERYWDRAVATLLALGNADDEANVPGIGRATIEAWDDLGHRYEVTPVQGASRGGWSEVAVELAPAIVPNAAALCIRVSEVPRGSEGARRLAVPGPFMFGIQLPPA